MKLTAAILGRRALLQRAGNPAITRREEHGVGASIRNRRGSWACGGMVGPYAGAGASAQGGLIGHRGRSGAGLGRSRYRASTEGSARFPLFLRAHAGGAGRLGRARAGRPTHSRHPGHRWRSSGVRPRRVLAPFRSPGNLVGRWARIAENPLAIRRALFSTRPLARSKKYPRLRTPAALVDLAADLNGVTATLHGRRALPARLAVAADGRESPMRERMGLRRDRMVLSANGHRRDGASRALRDEGVAYEHFLPFDRSRSCR